MSKRKPTPVLGAAIGAALGLMYGAIQHFQGWRFTGSGLDFLGAVQGSDQLVYMSINQAIWRAGNGLTYAYPLTVPPDATAPVLLQLPFIFTSAVGLITGLPWAYEILRVFGAALAGGLLCLLANHLVGSAQGQRAFLGACLLGGGLFWVKGLAIGLEETGVESVTILPDLYETAAGPFYWWLPQILPNLRLPIEPLNHAMIFGLFAALACRRRGVALAFGVGAWLTNPFPGLLASMVGGGVELLQSIHRIRNRRTVAEPMCITDHRWLIGWFLLTATALGYYGPFQAQWPDLAEVSRMHRMELSPPPGVLDMACLLGPWALGLLGVIPALRRGPHGLRHPVAAGLAIMACGQILLQVQGWIPGLKPFQPYHFNRGYLVVSLAGLLALDLPRQLRWLRRRTILRPGLWLPRRRSTVLMIMTALTCIDTLSFLQKDLLGSPPVESMATRDFARVLGALRTVPDSPRLVHSLDDSLGLRISAFTPHVPYASNHWIAFPFVQQRQQRLAEALANHTDGSPCPFQAFGITVVLLPANQSETLEAIVLKHGWLPVDFDSMRLWVAPELRDWREHWLEQHPPPHRPEPPTPAGADPPH